MTRETLALLALILALAGCAPVRAFLAPPVCHPTELIPNGDGGFTVYPDPCDYRGLNDR